MDKYSTLEDKHPEQSHCSMIAPVDNITMLPVESVEELEVNQVEAEKLEDVDSDWDADIFIAKLVL